MWPKSVVAEAINGVLFELYPDLYAVRTVTTTIPLDAGPVTLPTDAVVLSADDASDLSDRVYQVRCAAEDVATALDEGAAATELRELCATLLRAAQAADGWRRAVV